MTKTLTKSFYTKLYNELVDIVKCDDSYYAEICEGSYIALDCHVGKKFVTCNVCFATECHDESFDHLFGTWVDPAPYREVTGIDDIDDVHVYESEEEDAPEIAGFSYDDFWAPFESDTFILKQSNGKLVKVQAGDKLLVCGRREVVFLAYNRQKEACKLRSADGSVNYTQPRFLMRAPTDARLRAAMAAVGPDSARPLHELQVELALDDFINGFNGRETTNKNQN